MAKRYKNKVHRGLNDMNWEGDDDGHEYTGPHKLRRNKIDGMLGGVCSGIGDYVGIDHSIIRIITVIATFMTGGSTIPFYLLFWLLIPSDKRAPYREGYRKTRRSKRRHRKAAREMGDTPIPARTSANYNHVRSKFRSLETRLQDLEKSVTSREWKLRRDFRDLEG